MVFWLSVFIFKIFSKIYFRGKGYGKENFPDTGPYIGVINHNSNMDAVAMALVMKHRSYAMAKDSLFQVPILKWWVKTVGMFPIVRDAADHEAFGYALNLLKNGKRLFMAPEGTRKKQPGERKRPRTGFVRLAQLTGVPVVPIAIHGTDRVLPPGAWFPRPVKVRVKVGKPIKLEPIEAAFDKKDIFQQQADMVMGVVYQLLEELEKQDKP
jgi:1-acyl-sn-glycerol-3-phosphate acyltransferase